MKTVYGVKMFELKDILQHTGRPTNICDYLSGYTSIESEPFYDLFEDNEKLVLDISNDGNIRLANILKPLKLIFVPLDLVEEKIITSAALQSLKKIHNKVITQSRIARIEKAMDKYERQYDNLKDKVVNAQEGIEHFPCVVFIYEAGKFIDVYTAIPDRVLRNTLLDSPEYKCERCGLVEKPDHLSLTHFLPPMWYRLNSNREIDYYCNECKEATNFNDMKHVGE